MQSQARKNYDCRGLRVLGVTRQLDERICRGLFPFKLHVVRVGGKGGYAQPAFTPVTLTLIGDIMSINKFKCNIPHGWCEVLDDGGNCSYYSDSISHLWIEPSVVRRIRSCGHRKLMHRLEKAVMVDAKKIAEEKYSMNHLTRQWMKETNRKDQA